MIVVLVVDEWAVMMIVRREEPTRWHNQIGRRGLQSLQLVFRR